MTFRIFKISQIKSIVKLNMWEFLRLCRFIKYIQHKIMKQNINLHFFIRFGKF